MSVMPCSPTPALAMPLVTNTPRTFPAATFWRVMVTVGETNLLVV